MAEGLAQIRCACAANPHDAEAYAQLGRWLSKLHRTDEALEAVEHALRQEPLTAATLDTIGVVLSRAGRHGLAAQCFERATQLAPARADLQFNLASSHKFIGRLAAARTAYEKCIELDPRHWRAYWALAHLRPATAGCNDVARLERALVSARLESRDELLLRHALARELEDLGRDAEAFEHLVAGKNRHRAAIGYNVDRDLLLFETVARLFPADTPLPPLHDVAAGPIFVVGLPRTGTTLVERVLSSHAQVASAGESQNFGVLLKRATGTQSPRVLDEETLARSLDVDLAEAGREYLERTRPPGPKPRFVDKMPLNFFYLGHIARALPNARFVVLRRDPRDTGLSLFRQLFATRMSYYDFALDLHDIARYYAAFDRLVGHWRALLPDRLHEVSYEAFVTHFETETRHLLAHCGLPEDPACAAFERNAEPVATASAVQVRQGLNAGSIGRWRRYESQLAPMLETMRALGVRFPVR